MVYDPQAENPYRMYIFPGDKSFPRRRASPRTSAALVSDQHTFINNTSTYWAPAITSRLLKNVHPPKIDDAGSEYLHEKWRWPLIECVMHTQSAYRCALFSQRSCCPNISLSLELVYRRSPQDHPSTPPKKLTTPVLLVDTSVRQTMPPERPDLHGGHCANTLVDRSWSEDNE